MLAWLKRILIGHNHKWIIISRGPYTVVDDDGKAVENGTKYILQCEHCGKLKRFESV